MKTAKDILTDARALLEKGWVRGRFAADKDGKVCGIFDEEATSFCAVGALRRATGFNSGGLSDGHGFEALCLLKKSVECDDDETGTGELVGWNDRLATKEQVLSVFDTAIKEAQ